MATTREMAIGDPVELTVAAEEAPAGAKGAVVDLLDDGKVIVELAAAPTEPVVNRLLVVSRNKLRPLSA